MDTSASVTGLLMRAREGDQSAFERVWARLYEELKRLAQAQLRRERPGHTLHPTGLVHEAFLKLSEGDPVEWRSRPQFFAIAARAMRQLLIDHARRRAALKRGGDWQRTTLGVDELGFELSFGELLALDDALERLRQLDERVEKVVEYRFFGGMTDDEIAEVLEVSKRTVQRDWVKARAWLHKELYPQKQ